MNRDAPDLPDWHFSIEEVSMGVYLVTGVHRSGRCLERTGTDPEGLLLLLHAEARLDRDRRRSAST